MEKLTWCHVILPKRITGKMILKCVIFHEGCCKKKKEKNIGYRIFCGAGEELYEMEREPVCGSSASNCITICASHLK